MDRITLTVKVRFNRELTEAALADAPVVFAEQLGPRLKKELLTGASRVNGSKAWGWGSARVVDVEVTPT